MLVGDPLEAEILVGSDRAGGNGHPHHEGVGLLRSRSLAASPLVSRVLLVGPVELEQLDIVVLEVGRIGCERLRDAATEVPAVALGDFDFGFGFGGIVLRCFVESRESRV